MAATHLECRAELAFVCEVAVRLERAAVSFSAFNTRLNSTFRKHLHALRARVIALRERVIALRDCVNGT